MRPETFDKINDLMVTYAIKKKLEDEKKLRGDAAVVETDIHHPTDASLFWDSVRVLDRLMNGARRNCPSVKFEYHNRTRSAKKFCYKITMAKGKNADKIRGKYYRKLLKSARDVLDMAILCIAALGCDGLGFHENLAAANKSFRYRNYLAI